MSKRALLIGVNNYGEGFPTLNAPHNDVNAFAEVLSNPEIGAFDQVKNLFDPSPQEMEREIRDFFHAPGSGGLALLYFSGHGIVDDFSSSQFFLGTKDACYTNGDLYKTTVVSTELIYELIDFSPYNEQVIILDCCHSGAFGDILIPKDGREANIKKSLEKGSKRGRVILASCTPNQISYEHSNRGLSVYTHHLVNGLRIGEADIDLDGRITVEDLHYYVQKQVQSETDMRPEFLSLQLEASKLVLVEKTSVNKFTSQQLAKQQKLAAHLRENDDEYTTHQMQLDLEIEDRIAADIYTRIGKEKQRKSQLNKAISLYRSAIKLNQNDVETHQALGDVLCWQNKWSEAQGHYQYIIDNHPHDFALAQAYYGLGNTESNQNNPEAAFRAYTQANRLAPELANIYIDWGIALYHQGKFEIAIDKIKMSIQIDEINPRSHHFLGIFLSAIGQQKSSDAAIKCAINLWHIAIAQNQYDSNAYGLLANALTSQLKFTEVEATARKAIELNPFDAEAYNALGHFWCNQQKIEAAIEAYSQAISCNPCLVAVHANLGYALFLKGDLDGALAKYEYTLSLNPYLFDTYRRIGDVHYAQGKLSEAIQAYQQSIEINRYDLMTLHQLSSIFKLSGRQLEANAQNQVIIATAQKLIADDSTDVTAHYVLAEALASQNRFTEAMSIYLRISDTNYQSPYIHSHLGLMLLHHGQLETARKEFEIAIFQNPIDGIGFYGVGEVLRAQNQNQLATVQYQQSIYLNPNLPQAYVSLGHISLQQNDLNNAREYYQKAIDLNPYEAWNFHHLGIVLERLCQFDLAIEIISKAISLNPVEALFFNDLANIYAKTGDVFNAIQSYQYAVELQPTNPLYYYHLGCGLKQIGDLATAISEFRMAVRLDQKSQRFTDILANTLYQLVRESPDMNKAQKIKICEEIKKYHPNNPTWQKCIDDLLNDDNHTG